MASAPQVFAGDNFHRGYHEELGRIAAQVSVGVVTQILGGGYYNNDHHYDSRNHRRDYRRGYRRCHIPPRPPQTRVVYVNQVVHIHIEQPRHP